MSFAFTSQGSTPSRLYDMVNNYEISIASKIASQNTQKIALLRPHGVTANGVELYDLDLLDLRSKQLTTLLENTPRLIAMSFSDQGDKLVYIQSEVEDRIFSLSLEPGAKPKQIATCAQEEQITCNSVLWSPDGKSMSWSDMQGIWLADESGSAPRLIQPNQVYVTDPRGQQSTTHVVYDQLAWSPDSKFLLMKIIPSETGVQWYAILDTRKARLVDIPDSADYSNQSAKITWTYEGMLLLAHSSNPELDLPAFIHTWQIVPTSNNILGTDQIQNLEAQSSQGPQDAASATICPLSFQRLDAATYRLAMLDAEGKVTGSLNELNMEKNILKPLMEIPPDTEAVLWAPDASGALLLGKHGQILFASILNRKLIDLLPIVGEEAHSFSWLAPAPRN